MFSDISIFKFLANLEFMLVKTLEYQHRLCILKVSLSSSNIIVVALDPDAPTTSLGLGGYGPKRDLQIQDIVCFYHTRYDQYLMLRKCTRKAQKRTANQCNSLGEGMLLHHIQAGVDA